MCFELVQLHVVVDVHDLREEGSLFRIEETQSEKALSCFDNLLVINDVFNLNYFYGSVFMDGVVFNGVVWCFLV